MHCSTILSLNPLKLVVRLSIRVSQLDQGPRVVLIRCSCKDLPQCQPSGQLNCETPKIDFLQTLLYIFIYLGLLTNDTMTYNGFYWLFTTELAFWRILVFKTVIWRCRAAGNSDQKPLRQYCQPLILVAIVSYRSVAQRKIIPRIGQRWRLYRLRDRRPCPRWYLCLDYSRQWLCEKMRRLQ